MLKNIVYGFLIVALTLPFAVTPVHAGDASDERDRVILVNRGFDPFFRPFFRPFFPGRPFFDEDELFFDVDDLFFDEDRFDRDRFKRFDFDRDDFDRDDFKRFDFDRDDD